MWEGAAQRTHVSVKPERNSCICKSLLIYTAKYDASLVQVSLVVLAMVMGTKIIRGAQPPLLKVTLPCVKINNCSVSSSFRKNQNLSATFWEYLLTGRYAEKVIQRFQLAATLRWFTAGGAIHIAVRQLSQTWKLRHYDVITRKL